MNKDRVKLKKLLERFRYEVYDYVPVLEKHDENYTGLDEDSFIDELFKWRDEV